MKFFIVILAVILAVANAQHFGRLGGFHDSFGGLNLNAPLVQTRDARANTGPVVFPPAPADSGMTSGVVVGASGYGFVPPNNPGAKAQALPFY